MKPVFFRYYDSTAVTRQFARISPLRQPNLDFHRQFFFLFHYLGRGAWWYKCYRRTLLREGTPPVRKNAKTKCLNLDKMRLRFDTSHPLPPKGEFCYPNVRTSVRTARTPVLCCFSLLRPLGNEVKRNPFFQTLR